jgi:methionyl-tRNA formyltransferase
MADPLRLVFMGSDPVALPLLEWLAGEGARMAEIVGLVTGPDRPSGRGQSVRPNAVKAWACRRSVPILQPPKLDEDAHAALAELRPDLSLVVAYGQILREPIIALPRLGTLNLHASLLPRYRGASPIQTAVAAGDRETGMSLMRIIRELDAGPVADVERATISPLDTAQEVEANLAAAAIPLLERTLPLLGQGRLRFEAQEPGEATYCRRLEKTDGVLDFSASAAVLSARINGLHPWPSVAVDIAGSAIKLGLSDALGGEGGKAPGTVLGSDSEGLLVAAASGTLRLRRLQRPGGRMLDAGEFLRGFPIVPGTRLVSKPMPPLVAGAPFRR